MTSAFLLRPPVFFCSAIRYSRHHTTWAHRRQPSEGLTNPPGMTRHASYNRLMRSRLNLAMVAMAGSLALVLTVVRQSPEGVITLGLDTQEVRAAPGEARNLRHDLSALKIFNLVLVRIK